MKILYTAILLLSATFILVANEKDSRSTSDTIPRLNELSLVVTDLIDGSYMFRYERKLGSHISVGLGTGFKTESGLINISGIDRERLKTGDISYSGFKLVPDVRYYLNKTQQYDLDGFYFGAYMKYFHFSSNINGSYISKEETAYNLDIDADINVLSLGFMVGYKLAISKRFNVDFLIFGPGASRHKYKLDNKEPLPDEFYEDLNDALKNFSVFDLLESDVRFNFKDARAKFNTASFRYGLTIGYTF